MNMQDKIAEFFYELNVRCDWTIEDLAGAVVDICSKDQDTYTVLDGNCSDD